MMTTIDLAAFASHTTEHYVFHYHPGSPAQRDILAIASEQERCFARITRELGVTPQEPICYILCGTSRECAQCWQELFNDDTYEELNGFADCPYGIYAVYNDDIQCIGAHEDAHLIAHLIANQTCGALCEGLAMYFDGVWWGEDNLLWVRRFLADEQFIPLRELLDNDVFYARPCEITYPIAGAFTRFAVEKAGMAAYLAQVYAHGAAQEAIPRLESLFGQPLDAIEKDFLTWIQA